LRLLFLKELVLARVVMICKKSLETDFLLTSATLTDIDTGSGMLVKEAGQKAVPLLKSAGVKRQCSDACNAILTDCDTGFGMAVREAGQNAASLLKSLA
jgi:hypothetical protein